MVSKSLVVEIKAGLGHYFYMTMVPPPWSLLIPIQSIVGYNSVDALATFVVQPAFVIFSLPYPSIIQFHFNPG